MNEHTTTGADSATRAGLGGDAQVPGGRFGRSPPRFGRPKRGGLTGKGRNPVRALWNAILAVIGTLVGLAPHVLHHVGLLAGTALIAGAGGTALFAVLGLLTSIPFLLKLRRRFRTWWAPAIGLAVFAGMFSLSAFVIGPAISGDDGSPTGPAPSPTSEHSDHH